MQGSVFDLEQGQAARDEGMARVTSHTPESYRRAFEAQVRDFKAMGGRKFTSEDVTARIGPPPNHVNAIGALTRAVAIQYGAEKLGYVPATRTKRHAGAIAVWGWL